MRNKLHTAFDKITGRLNCNNDYRSNTVSQKRNTEKSGHKYASSIGGDASNYKGGNNGK